MNERKKELMLAAGYAAPELATRGQELFDLVVQAVLKIVDEQRDPLSLNYSPKARIKEAILMNFPQE